MCRSKAGCVLWSYSVVFFGLQSAIYWVILDILFCFESTQTDFYHNFKSGIKISSFLPDFLTISFLFLIAISIFFLLGKMVEKERFPNAIIFICSLLLYSKLWINYTLFQLMLLDHIATLGILVAGWVLLKLEKEIKEDEK